MLEIKANISDVEMKVDGRCDVLTAEMVCVIDAFCRTISEDTMLTKDEILDNHVIVKSKKDLIDASIKKDFISLKECAFGFEGLISNRKKAYELFGNEAIYEKCTLEDILLYYTRRD